MSRPSDVFFALALALALALPLPLPLELVVVACAPDDSLVEGLPALGFVDAPRGA
jgi:hypothetical protein